MFSYWKAVSRVFSPPLVGEPSLLRKAVFGFSRLTLLLALLVIAVVTPNSVWAQSEKRTVKVGVYQNAPQIFIEKDGTPKGIYIDLLARIAALENWRLIFVPGTFADGLEAVRNGRVDVMTSIAATPERKKFVDFSNETIVSIWGQLYVDPEFNPQNIFALHERKVAVMRDGLLGKKFAQLCKDFGVDCQVTEVPSYDHALQAIDDGKVDAAVVNSLLGFSRESLYNAKRSAFVFSPYRLQIAVPKGQNQDILNKVDGYIKAWRSDKKSPYHQTLDRWLGLKPIETTVIPIWVWWALAGFFAFFVIFFTWNRALSREVSKRKQTEISLQQERDLFRSSIESLPGIFYMVSDEQKFDVWNHNLEKTSRYSNVEIETLSYLDLFPSADRPAVEAHIKKVMESGEETIEASIASKDGFTKPFFLVGKRVEIDGKPRFIGAGIDLTERKQLEEQIRRSQKMEAVGYLTGGIAHDFNNILGIVMGNLELLQRLISGNEKAMERLAKAINGTKRGADLTQKLLRFSRKSSPETSQLSLSEFLRELEELIAKSLTVAVKVETDLAEDLWPIGVDPGELQDTILNLAINARDAMPDGGTLTFKTANRTLDETYAKLNPGSRAGDFVMLSVSDTGVGMTDDIKEQIFEPFFTTKKQGKGTGLGLSMVYGFIQRANGHLQVSSVVGKGTTFNLFIPLAAPEMGNQPVAQADEIDLPEGSEKILIVDDEEDLRETAAYCLSSLGYKTFTAEDGNQALQVLKENPDIDLLFSDVIMPGNMDGYRLAGETRKIFPSLQILLASGYTNRHEKSPLGNDDEISRLNRDLLAKPYSQKELAQAVRRMLD